MPDYYERAHMETAPDGAPTKIAEARLRKRLDTKAAKAEKVTERIQRKKKRSRALKNSERKQQQR